MRGCAASVRAAQARVAHLRARLIWIALAGLLVGACAEARFAEVVAVAGGDSFVATVDGARTRVRLAGIDAPERGQPWNRRARQALEEKILHRSVRLDVVTTDRYGRLVAHVWLGERHINREMIREGHAWVYTRHLVDASLNDDEAAARAARRGLWSQSDPIEPWLYRRERRPAQGG